MSLAPLAGDGSGGVRLRRGAGLWSAMLVAYVSVQGRSLVEWAPVVGIGGGAGLSGSTGFGRVR